MQFNFIDTRKRTVIFFFYLVCLFFYACKPNNVPPEQIDMGYDYFPLDTGNYIIYDVQTIEYKFDGTIDTQYYQLKELVKDTLTDDESKLAFRLERFRRTDSSANWPFEPDSVWTAKITSYHAIKVESNIPYVKLVFPVKNRIEWDGNAFNTLEKKEGDEYRIEDLDLEYTIGNRTFKNSLKVIHPFITSNIGKYERYEVYAKNYGLIYKESILVDYTPECIISDSCDIELGKKYFQIFNKSGKE